MKNRLTRRSCLKQGLWLCATSSIALIDLGCGSANSDAFTCTDLTGLTADEVAMRRELEYVDVATDQRQTCSNCGLYVVPTGAARCGGCRLVRGPFHPKGYCNAWAPLTL
jgi:hypothetical protein